MADSGLRNFNFEWLLAIGGALILIGIFLPWAKGGKVPLRGYDKYIGYMTFAGGWISIVGAMNGYDLFKSRWLEDKKPYTDAGLGLIGGALSLLGFSTHITTLPPAFSFCWETGSILVVVGSALAIFVSIIITWQETTTESAERKTRSRKESGGL